LRVSVTMMWDPAGGSEEGPEDAEKLKWDAGRRGMADERCSK
jgi:hypothetical protein